MIRCIAIALLLPGCAALSKSKPLDVRFFTPEAELPPAAAAPAQGAALRLGRVSAGPELGEEIAWRDSPVEVGFYDDSRWTDRPDAYVRRALERALFQDRGLRHVLSGPAPVLDVRVVAFEELRAQGKGPGRARVTLAALLHDERSALHERSYTQEVELASGRIEDLVQGIGRAMRQAAEQVAAQVAGVLPQQ